MRACVRVCVDARSGSLPLSSNNRFTSKFNGIFSGLMQKESKIRLIPIGSQCEGLRDYNVAFPFYWLCQVIKLFLKYRRFLLTLSTEHFTILREGRLLRRRERPDWLVD